MKLLRWDTSHLGQSLRNGLAIQRTVLVSASAGNLGAGGLSQVSSQVVFGLGRGRVDGAALSEEGGDQVLLRGPFL